MEDEECLPENSSLKHYLQNLGFSDVQVTKNVTLNRTNLKFEVSAPKSKSLKVEPIDEEVINQIGILISTQMLFEEDISNIERVLSSFKVVKNGMIKSMFQGFFGVVIIFVGLCLYWIIGNYAFVIVSSFYAYNAAYYLQRKHFNQSRLKKLTAILQTNFLLLKKAIKFIEENNKFIECNKSTLKNETADLMEGFDYYNSFKSDFVISVTEMISIFIKSTKKLIKAVPLCDYLESPEYYLCNNFNKNYDSNDFSNLYQVYLLLQSEFLQRLSLSLIPNIKLSAKGDNFKDLNSILTEACVNLLKIKNKLNRKFKFIFVNGVHNPKTKVFFKLPTKNSDSGVLYKNEFVLNIHETSNTFQNLLINSRILETKLMSDEIPRNLEDDLVNIQNDLNSCQRNIADSFILLKKANAIKGVPEVVQLKEEHQQSEATLDKVFVGYTDLDPKIEDEIFEAYFGDENLNTNLASIDDWDFDDQLKKKLEKEYSQSVIKELKIKLVEKAKNWEKREAELMKRKGFNNEIEQSLKESVNEAGPKIVVNDGAIKEEDIKKFDKESGIESQGLKLKINENFFANDSKDHLKKNSSDTNFERSSGSDNENMSIGESQSSYDFDEFLQSNIQGINTSFLKDLGQTRQRILKISGPVEEEFYCDSGEDSCEEDCLT